MRTIMGHILITITIVNSQMSTTYTKRNSSESSSAPSPATSRCVMQLVCTIEAILWKISLTPADQAEIIVTPSINLVGSPYLYVTATFVPCSSARGFWYLNNIFLTLHLALRRDISVVIVVKSSSRESLLEIMEIGSKYSGIVLISSEDFLLSETAL